MNTRGVWTVVSGRRGRFGIVVCKAVETSTTAFRIPSTLLKEENFVDGDHKISLEPRDMEPIRDRETQLRSTDIQ